MSTNVISLSRSSKCPCGSQLKYIKCCGQYTKQGNKPLTAEALMRSRYTAYVIKNEQYLLNSWHSSTRPAKLDLDNDSTEWCRLEIVATDAGKPADDKGTVEFIACFKVHNQRQQLHEVSRFVKEAGQWFYLDGEHNE